MSRVIYSAPNADPQMDGLEWTQDRGELISPELTDEQAARYLTIDGFRLAETPKPAEPPKPAETPKADPTDKAKAKAEAKAAAAAEKAAAEKAAAEETPATDAGAAGDTAPKE